MKLRKTMAEEQKHICGKCGQEFTAEEEYLEHTCSETGFTPQEPENLGEEFKTISEAALKRGEARK
jgi:DNA-directed RNA polymerase subunit RPC12/RpoP